MRRWRTRVCPAAKSPAAGIGSPGPLDVKSGVILFSANMNVQEFPARAGAGGEARPPGAGAERRARRRLRRVPARGRARLSRHHRGVRRHRDRRLRDPGGQIVEGSTGNAGEIGHIIVKAGGPRCGCGARGCMEALASKTAIARRVNKAMRKGLPTVLADKMARKGGRLKSGDLAEAVAAKDLVALKEVQRAAHFLGLGLGSLINVLGPEIVIIGGGVAGALGDPYLELVRSAARSQAFTDPERNDPDRTSGPGRRRRHPHCPSISVRRGAVLSVVRRPHLAASSVTDIEPATYRRPHFVVLRTARSSRTSS